MDYLKDTDPFDHQIFDYVEVISIIFGLVSVLGAIFSIKFDRRTGRSPGLTTSLSSSVSAQNVWLST
jgi:heme/copper-type cytochrome/quinol oxidase subunit 2